MRLDKFLVDCGLGSRSQVKTYLKKKQVTVNGQVETSPKTQIDSRGVRRIKRFWNSFGLSLTNSCEIGRFLLPLK